MENTENQQINPEQIKEILSNAGLYEEKLKTYRFYNWELAELEKIEGNVNKLIVPYLNNDEILLSMIKEHWSIIGNIDLSTKSNEFLLRACTANPRCVKKCVNSDRGMPFIFELYKLSPKAVSDIIGLWPSTLKEQFMEYVKAQLKATIEKPQEFYSLDGQKHDSMEAAMAKNEEIQNSMTVGPSK